MTGTVPSGGCRQGGGLREPSPPHCGAFSRTWTCRTQGVGYVCCPRGPGPGSSRQVIAGNFFPAWQGPGWVRRRRVGGGRKENPVSEDSNSRTHPSLDSPLFSASLPLPAMNTHHLHTAPTTQHVPLNNPRVYTQHTPPHAPHTHPQAPHAHSRTHGTHPFPGFRFARKCC